VILAFPLICLELWFFIRPGLRPVEQRYIYVLLPAAVVLFAAGIAFCYVIAPQALGYLLIFNTQLGVQAQFTVASYLRFFMRILIVFGLAFETPLVMMFLARIGVITSEGLLSTWRMAIVIITIIAAMVTPTPDPFNLALVAVPMIILYFLSVGLTVIAERAQGNPPSRKAGTSAEGAGDEEKADTEAAGEDGTGQPDDRP
jgi:sec-independent protein translocase protein TatC